MRIIKRFVASSVAMAWSLSSPAVAEVLSSGDNGFAVSHTISTPAEPFVAYRTMTSHIDQWWNRDHSWSGDAENLYMDIELGGCFCERLARN